MIPLGFAPILLTLGSLQVARFTRSPRGYVVAAVLELSAAIALLVATPSHTVPVAIAVLMGALWHLVFPDPAGSSRGRLLRPLGGLVLLAVALGVQAWLLDLDWSALPASARDLALALLLMEPATRAVRLILAVAGSPVQGAEIGAGEIIGTLERLIIFLLILANGYAAIGFVIAAKGLARYEKMKDEKQAEYVLLGTLASVFLVLLVGVARPG